MQTRFDVLTIGNAIVDVLSRVEEDFIVSQGLKKGIMHLIDADRMNFFYERLPVGVQEISGGSAANTAAGVASLGGRGAFVGKVAADDWGRFFAKDMHRIGCHFETPMLEHGSETARSMILITPDGERTMNTYLGACQELTVNDIIEDEIGGSAITFMEGYLWDPPEAKRAFVKAAELAHKHGRSAAITLSDPFCVDRFRTEFIDLLRSGTIDTLLANEEELISLYQTATLDEAVTALKADCNRAAITRGANGAMTVVDGEVTEVPVYPVETVEDATGAGDLFASGFLYGLATGRRHHDALALGCLCAAEVITHVGARPVAHLKTLATKEGLLGG
ncbi:adenosine kinase [Cucumibacter marinus]|uniref:adenosine kinase n=1 Tax=Cucumibacter marinus TaxID=1121252 RepID=UPI00042A4AE9|nr:adenosine kinase [Cucumibacter marinus]